MGAVVFSDIHADSQAISAVASYIGTRLFERRFGKVDLLINLGDLLHRGNRPKETLEIIHTLSRKYPMISVLNRLLVSGSDAESTYAHEQLRGSPLLSIFEDMPMEYTDHGILFVHGGPLEMGDSTLRLKCWQRLSRQAGDCFSGYHYTAKQAFTALEMRGLTHMCFGHQHTRLCCVKRPIGITNEPIRFEMIPERDSPDDLFVQASRFSLEQPSLFRVGGCHGREPEFAYTDFSTFSYIRILPTY
jgi:hypothetical protein